MKYLITIPGALKPFEFESYGPLSQVRSQFGPDAAIEQIEPVLEVLDDERVVSVGVAGDEYMVKDMTLARNRDQLSKDDALRLAKHPSKFIRAALASNPRITPAARKVLRMDANAGVISTLLSNPTTSRDDYRFIRSKWRSVTMVANGDPMVVKALTGSRHH